MSNIIRGKKLRGDCAEIPRGLILRKERIREASKSVGKKHLESQTLMQAALEERREREERRVR